MSSKKLSTGLYNFQKHLFPGEKILYQDSAVSGKGDRSIGGEIFLVLFSLGCQALLIWSVVAGVGDGADGITLTFIIVFLATAFFGCIGIYSILDKLFLKKWRTADDFYCLTNLRALKYESKKDELTFGYLSNYDLLSCQNVKNKFGDLYMTVDFDKKFKEDGIEDSAQQLACLKDVMMHPNPQNRPTMLFESIKNPRQVLAIAKEAKENCQQDVPKDFILKPGEI